ncbi:carbonic anhydrase [Amylocarpus encephaloides]|uniref:Carbonic anhydrase n=1 Tax=Amylocarpus encephaloides TaxID=45428 RepID=A0A9P7YP90_9HELO|nr:carbonic anhydrase [Amylocarpus encephaloides]
MPFNAPTILRTPYTTRPVPRDLIASSPSSATEGKPHILWVGCSDSSVMETEALGVGRDEMFVHRNLGHLLSNGDLSSRSAVEWSVELLKVDHIVVCGHYGCAMIQQLENEDLPGPKKWYKDVAKLHDQTTLDLSEKHIDLPQDDLYHRFEEVYVLAEIDWLKRQPLVQKAVNERGMQIHAFVWDEEAAACVQLVAGEAKA